MKVKNLTTNLVLPYSVSQNAALCFSCRLFGKQVSWVNKDAIISTVGFSKWKRALDSFREHETCTGHKACSLRRVTEPV